MTCFSVWKVSKTTKLLKSYRCGRLPIAVSPVVSRHWSAVWIGERQRPFPNIRILHAYWKNYLNTLQVGHKLSFLVLFSLDESGCIPNQINSFKISQFIFNALVKFNLNPNARYHLTLRNSSIF